MEQVDLVSPVPVKCRFLLAFVGLAQVAQVNWRLVGFSRKVAQPTWLRAVDTRVRDHPRLPAAEQP